MGFSVKIFFSSFSQSFFHSFDRKSQGDCASCCLFWAINVYSSEIKFRIEICEGQLLVSEGNIESLKDKNILGDGGREDFDIKKCAELKTAVNGQGWTLELPLGELHFVRFVALNNVNAQYFGKENWLTSLLEFLALTKWGNMVLY